MNLILRILLSCLIVIAHALGMYYFYSADWVDRSNVLIAWVSLIQVGISMSLLFYLGLVIKIPTKSKYFNPINLENNGVLYEKLGIKQFKFVLFRSPFVFLNKDIKFKKYGKSQIEKLENRMRIVEFGHLIGFLIVLGIIPLMSLRHWKFAIWLNVFNIFLHLYPVFLQRYNRHRINKIIAS